MSEIKEETIRPTEPEEHAGDHPYLQTFIALFILTAIEVAVGYIETTPLIATILILLALAKAVLVGAIFMHIAYSKEALRIVLSVFIVPFIVVVLLVLTVWSDWREPLGFV